MLTKYNLMWNNILFCFFFCFLFIQFQVVDPPTEVNSGRSKQHFMISVEWEDDLTLDVSVQWVDGWEYKYWNKITCNKIYIGRKLGHFNMDWEKFKHSKQSRIFPRIQLIIIQNSTKCQNKRCSNQKQKSDLKEI